MNELTLQVCDLQPRASEAQTRGAGGHGGGGHVFVVKTDIACLECDGWLLPMSNLARKEETEQKCRKWVEANPRFFQPNSSLACPPSLLSSRIPPWGLTGTESEEGEGGGGGSSSSVRWEVDESLPSPFLTISHLLSEHSAKSADATNSPPLATNRVCWGGWVWMCLCG